MIPARDAILFPGQGSQHDGMRAMVERDRPDLLEEVVELVGADPFDRLDGSTAFVQPAVFCASIVCWERVRAAVRPVAFAGHSLGELAALVAAGALDAHAALRLAVVRGRLTAEVAEAVGGGMVALLGVGPEDARAIAGRCGLTVANDNCPGQTVLSGPDEGLARSEAEVHALEGKVRRLAVQGPFHSAEMAPAHEPYARALAEVEFRPPAAPVYSCVTAAPFTEPARELADSLLSGVRWRDVLNALQDVQGATRFVETGPGAVLTKMTRRTLRGVSFVAAERDPLDPSAVATA